MGTLDAIANRSKIVDNLCILRNPDGTAITASAAATAAQTGQSVPFDTGGGHTEGDLVLTVASCVTGATISDWLICLQGSVDSSFASMVNLTTLQIGIAAKVNHVLGFDSGRWIIPWSNSFNGYLYRYLRLYAFAGATPGIVGMDYSGHLAMNQ